MRTRVLIAALVRKMSTSTDAILVYGIDFGEEPWEPLDDVVFDDIEAAKLANPLGYMSLAGEVQDRIAIVWHCSDDCPMYIVSVAASRRTAGRGNPLVVGTLVVEPGWDDIVAAFLAKYKLTAPISQPKPEWLLCSYWG